MKTDCWNEVRVALGAFFHPEQNETSTADASLFARISLSQNHW
jgi:hypothetical protein